MSTYEKELVTLVSAVLKRRHYLFGWGFVVRTNQRNLKYLLDQKVGTPMQQKWIAKLLAFDFIMEYKKGSESRVTDSLFRKVQEGEGALMLISFPSVDWVEKLRMAYEADSQLKRLLEQCTTGRLGSNYTLRD